MTNQLMIAKASVIALFLIPATGDAEERGRLPTVGQIWLSNPSMVTPYDKAFRQGLADLGYVEGKNIRIVARYANGDSARLPTLLNELIALPPDVLLVSQAALGAARKATTTVPLVCATMGDPVAAGLVSSLARPGGNLTGLYALDTETDSKRLELAREIVPALKRIGLLFEPNDATRFDADAFRALARDAGFSVRTFPVRSLEDIRSALGTMDKERPQALIVWSTSLIVLHRDTILGFAAQRFPVISEGRALAQAGALLTYSANFYEMYRASAVYVDKILKGNKPADLPVEQPTKLELIVNLKTAKALGITIPQSILLRADEVIR
jgi:putative ABC transport system substrate-binding protein